MASPVGPQVKWVKINSWMDMDGWFLFLGKINDKTKYKEDMESLFFLVPFYGKMIANFLRNLP
jgi:hypothetical protein